MRFYVLHANNKYGTRYYTCYRAERHFCDHSERIVKKRHISYVIEKCAILQLCCAHKTRVTQSESSSATTFSFPPRMLYVSPLTVTIKTEKLLTVQTYIPSLIAFPVDSLANRIEFHEHPLICLVSFCVAMTVGYWRATRISYFLTVSSTPL